MSLPRYFAAPWDGFRHLPTLYDQHFGLGMSLHEVIDATIGHMRSGHLGPSRHGGHHVVKSDGTFEVMIDVQQFAPNEIFVKTVENEVVVEGKHEEKKDEHGYISRHFVRRYKIPEGVKVEAITSSLSSDGVLTITTPKAPPVEEGNVRHIPIKATGSPAVMHSHPHSVSRAANDAAFYARDEPFGNRVVPQLSKVQHAHEGPHSHAGSQAAHSASHVLGNTEENEPPLAIKATAANPTKEGKK